MIIAKSLNNQMISKTELTFKSRGILIPINECLIKHVQIAYDATNVLISKVNGSIIIYHVYYQYLFLIFIQNNYIK